MPYYVRMRRNGRKFGELGPFSTRAVAVEQAQPFADQAAAGVVVTVEPARARRRRTATPPRKKRARTRRRNSVGVTSMAAGRYYVAHGHSGGEHYFKPTVAGKRDDGGWLKGLTAAYNRYRDAPTPPAMKGSIEKRGMRMYSPIAASALPAKVRAAFADPILSSRDPRLRHRNPSTKKRTRSSKGSQALYARVGRKIKKGALMAVAPRPIRRALLAFGFALLDPKVSVGDKFLAMGGAAPVALADGPVPGPADLAALGLTVAKARAIVKPRHIAKADKLLERA